MRKIILTTCLVITIVGALSYAIWHTIYSNQSISLEDSGMISVESNYEEYDLHQDAGDSYQSPIGSFGAFSAAQGITRIELDASGHTTYISEMPDPINLGDGTSLIQESTQPDGVRVRIIQDNISGYTEYRYEGDQLFLGEIL